MKEISRFRGLAGEVAGGILSPFTFFSAIPVVLVFLALGFLVGKVSSGMAEIAVAPVLIGVYAMIVGRFALPARHGELDGGFFVSSCDFADLPGFAGRYLVLTLAWGLPFALLGWALLDRETLFYGAMGAFSPMDAAQLGMKGVLLLAMGLVVMFMPTLCFIVTTRTDSIADALSPDTWGWMLSERRADLAAFYVGLIGGMIVLVGLYLIPFALVAALAFKTSLQAGVAVSGFLYLLMLAVSPILLGRLCGAFVAGEGGMEKEAADLMETLGIVPTASRPLQAPQNIVAPEQALKLGKKPVFGEIIDQVKALPPDALGVEIAKAEARLAAQPRDPHSAAELSLLYKRAGEKEKSLKAAANAITQAVRDGFSELGMSLFRVFAKERDALGLDALTLEVVGNLLLNQGELLSAGWCLHESAVSAGDVVKAQKKLLHVAGVAEESGKFSEAISLYDYLIGKYPESPLKQYAAQGKERAQAEKGEKP